MTPRQELLRDYYYKKELSYNDLLTDMRSKGDLESQGKET